MKNIALTGSFALVAFAVQAERIELKTDYASCVVETRGARVMSFRPAGGEEVLWQAEPVQLTDAKWAHGGIPLCWPWFGVNGRVDIHGTAWRRPFSVVTRREGKNRCELVLARDEGDVRLEYTLVLRDSLKLELKTTNRGKQEFSFSAEARAYYALEKLWA